MQSMNPSMREVHANEAKARWNTAYIEERAVHGASSGDRAGSLLAARRICGFDAAFRQMQKLPDHNLRKICRDCRKYVTT